MRTVGIRNIDPRTLRDAPRNANVMGSYEHETLVASMRDNGCCTQPLLVREIVDASDIDGVYEEIVDGHHRKAAAIEAGLPSVPCVVVVCDDDEAIALGLVHNRVRGELDTNITGQLLHELEAAGWTRADMALTGFAPSELDTLLALGSASNELSDLLGANTSAPVGEPVDEEKSARVFELKIEFKTPEALRAVKRVLNKRRGKGEGKRSLAFAVCAALALDEQAEKE